MLWKYLQNWDRGTYSDFLLALRTRGRKSKSGLEKEIFRVVARTRSVVRHTVEADSSANLISFFFFFCSFGSPNIFWGLFADDRRSMFPL